MTLKVTEGQYYFYSIGHISLPISGL